MRRRQRQIIAMFTIVTMLLPLLAGCGSEVSKLPGESTMETTEESTTEEMPAESQETTENTTEASEMPDTLVEIKLSFDEIKKELLTVDIGREEGQVGYDPSPAGPYGPGSFAVEDGVIYILDTVNERINIYENDKRSQISDIGNIYRRMRYQDRRIAVLDNSQGVEISVYKTEDGTLEKKIDVSEHVEWGDKLLTVGENYVEFLNTGEHVSERITYNWNTDELEKSPYSSLESRIHSSILEKQKWISVIGVYEDEIYYSYEEFDQQTLIINREDNKGNQWSVQVDSSSWYAPPLEHLYLSSDGSLYIMECFEDRTVISELVLLEPTTKEPTTEEYSPVSTMQVLDDVKREVLTLYPGTGDGQVGYVTGIYKEGPESFAIEDGAVYILDPVNHRIIIKDGEQYSYIHVDEFSKPTYMKYQDGKIGVIDNSYRTTTIYRLDGKSEALIKYPSEIQVVSRLMNFGDTYVEWYSGDIYQYEWNKKTLTKIEYTPEKVSVNTQAPSSIEIIGSFEDMVYYIHNDVSTLSTKIYMENTNGDRWYTQLADAQYYSYPLENVYLSEDGKLYLMECFDDRTVISELLLGGEAEQYRSRTE